MRIGVDLGTTRTLVAVVDRGNYPVVGFLDGHGDSHEHFPSVAAEVGGKLVYGFEALRAAADDGAPLLRSFKRALASPDVGAEDRVQVGTVEVTLLELLSGFLGALKAALLHASNAPRQRSDEQLEAVVAVPAHAHGAQRFLTMEAFRRAGFVVKAMINEPSAAGFEFTHRQTKAITAKRSRVLVYDLGGGTFDASVVKVEGVRHDVLGTAGLNKLGGDDFDALLLGQVLAAAGLDSKNLDARARTMLLEQCREAKERITPKSRRIAVEVETPRGTVEVTVPVDTFYAAVTPLVQETIDVIRPLLRSLDNSPATLNLGDDVEHDALSDFAGMYLVGGGSGLPRVQRLLKDAFGRRVHRSPHPAASTAIGLAIAADDEAGFTLADRFSRGFGVFRDRDAGKTVAFDPIFRPDVTLPKAGDAVVIERRYRAAHNVGWFRFVDCARFDEAGEPRGDLVPCADVVFPFDPELQEAAQAKKDQERLQSIVVERRGQGPVVEERYTIDPHGLVEVNIADLDTGYRRTYRIGS